MLYVDFANGVFFFTADAPAGTGKPQLWLAFPPGDPGGTWRERHHFVTTHEEIKLARGIGLVGIDRLADPTTDIVYKLIPEGA